MTRYSTFATWTMKFQNQTLHLLQFKTNLNMFMCVLFCYRLFVSLRMRMPTSNQQPQNKNIRIVRIAGVPSGQALPGFFITSLLSVIVSAVPGTQAVWIPNQKNNNNQQDLSRGNRLPSGGALWSDSSDTPLGLVCECGLDNSSSRLNVAHTAYHTFLKRWCGCGTTNWYCLTSNSATQPRTRRPSPPSQDSYL